MKTNRIFTGNIYRDGKIEEEEIILIYYPNRGYVPVHISVPNIHYLFYKFGILNKYFLETYSKLYYIDRNSIRPFTYDFIDGVSSVSIKQLKYIADKYYKNNHKKTSN